MSRSHALRSPAANADVILGSNPDEAGHNMLVAQRVMAQLAGLESRPLPEVRTAIVPASSFSGDQLVAERTPAGVLQLFLADGIGHGLVPALLALPLTRTFSTMSRKGFSLPAIVTELNTTIRKYRMPDQFVAVTLAAYDPFTGCIEVWNGGNPDGLLIDRDGALLQRFASTQLPLGLCEPGDLDTRTVSARVPVDAQLLLYSDGLIEAGGGAQFAGHFGETRLLACAARHAARERVDAVMAEVRAHLGARHAHDDISMLSMDCTRHSAVAHPSPAAAEPCAATAEARETFRHWQRQSHWNLSLRLDAETLRRVDAVPVIQNFLRDFNPAPRDHSRQFVVLSELFNNALDHGLLQLDSRIKDGPGGMGGYFEERARRLAALQEGEIVIEAAGAWSGGRRAMCLTVRDSGKGFQHQAVLEPSEAAAPHGRGIGLVRSLSDGFHYEGPGNVAQALCCSDESETRETE